jgi:hypothetical protein
VIYGWLKSVGFEICGIIVIDWREADLDEAARVAQPTNTKFADVGYGGI